MGQKLEQHTNKRRTNKSPQEQSENSSENNHNNSNSSCDNEMDTSPTEFPLRSSLTATSSPIATLNAFMRRRWKIIAYICLIVAIIFMLMILGEKLKGALFGVLRNNRDISFPASCLVILIGTLMVLVGAPILLLEISLGAALLSYPTAVIIASCSKLFGIAISYFLSLKLFSQTIAQKFRDNVYLRTLQVIGRDKPKKALTLLAIIQIPMLLKNYSLPLFNASFSQILLCFCSVQVAQAMLYCFVGSTFDFDQDNDDPNNHNDQPHRRNHEKSWIKDVMAYLSYIITVIVFYFVYKQTQKIRNEAESMEMVEKIAYLPEREQEKVQVNMIYPNISAAEEEIDIEHGKTPD